MTNLDTLPPALRPLIEQFLADATGYMVALENGSLTIPAWRKVMAESLARYHMAALMVGQNSTDITPDVARLLANTVDVQLSFLDNFARVMEAAPADMQQWAMWNARAQQYALSPKSSWAEGDVIRQTGRVLPLPAMPCQGVQCGNNCLCTWKIEQIGDNSYTAAWIRHADDSCQTCVIRGQGWGNLVIEDGVLLSESTTTKHLAGQHDQKTHGRSNGAYSVNDAKTLVSSYLGVNLGEQKIEVLDPIGFNGRFGSPDDEIHGGVAAIRTPDGSIYLKKGLESDAIHELVHAAGALEEGTNAFINEGVTQAAAEAIGKVGLKPVRETYGKETGFVKNYILPTAGIPAKQFFRGYVKAGDKAKYIADLVWAKHGNRFGNIDDWGRNPYQRLLNDMRETIGTSSHLMYLVDEVGV